MTKPPFSISDGLTPEQQSALGNLDELETQLASWAIPELRAEATERLMARLSPLVAARTRSAPLAAWRYWLGLAWSQATLLEAPFWWSGALVLLLGAGLALVGNAGAGGLLLVSVSPVLAAGGVAYLFRPAARGLGELEKTAPVRPLELLYGRLAIILGCNLVLALGAMGLLALGGAQVAPGRLLLAWLGPMLALTGVALYATARWGALAGIAAPLFLWGGITWLASRGATVQGPGLQPVSSWVLNQIDTSAWLPGLMVLAAACGLVLVWQASRWLARETPQWS